jgi:hypothetical protein
VEHLVILDLRELLARKGILDLREIWVILGLKETLARKVPQVPAVLARQDLRE